MSDINKTITDPEYKQWISNIERRFRQQQIKAAVQVNSYKIEFYWSLGRDICEMHVEERWGESVIKQLSEDLRLAIDEAKGITPGNLYYCKRFYLLYSQLFEKVPQVGEIFYDRREKGIIPAEKQIVPQLVEIFKPQHQLLENEGRMPLNIFAVPWGHHKAILDRYDSEPMKALFYAAKTLEHSWSRAVLENMMGDKGKDNGLYERQGKSVNNFPATMPYPTGDLAAEMISDPLNMSFLKLKAKYDEHTLKQALIRHVNDLLMSLGTGFAYIRNEYLLSVAGKEQFSDLLFYNTKLHAYVVVEVKVTEFESSYLGQLSGYMSLVNHILKDDIDRPTIGLLICRSKNNVFAQYCLEGYNQPIAITAYEGIQILPENFNDTLPSIEELEAEIDK